MSEAELTNAAWWAHVWGEIEHWSFLAVVVFLAIEFAALKFAAPYREKLENAREERIAAANERAAKSELELARYRAPREISDEQKAKIIEAIKPFAGAKFDMTSQQDFEPLNLRRRLEGILIEAGWEQIDWAGMGFGFTEGGKQFGTNTAAGVLVTILPEEVPALSPAVLALINSLVDCDITAAGQAGPANASNAGTIHLHVGRKP